MLSCDCDYGDDVEWWFDDSGEVAPLATKRMRRCCYASTCGEHEPNAIVREFRDAIAGDWVLEKRLADRLAERAARQSRGLGYGESVSDKYLEAEIYELQAAISKEQP